MAIFNGFGHIHGVLMTFYAIKMACEYSSVWYNFQFAGFYVMFSKLVREKEFCMKIYYLAFHIIITIYCGNPELLI